MKVILFGASGMVGQGVLRECLNDAQVTQVLSVVRNVADAPYSKLKQLVAKDMLNFDAFETELTGYDACFFCLGSSAAGQTEQQYAAINHDIPLAAGKALARFNPRMCFVYVSGAGTDSTEQGRTMWARVKGRTENALLRLPFNAFMFRPAAIEPMHGETSKTLLYRLPIMLMRPLFPLMQKLFPDAVTTTERMGRAMLNVARRGFEKKILESRDINQAAQRV